MLVSFAPGGPLDAPRAVDAARAVGAPRAVAAPGVTDGKRISPDEGASSPAMIWSSVDLPQPEGPSRIRNSPGATSRVMDSSALTRSAVRAMSQTLPTARTARG